MGIPFEQSVIQRLMFSGRGAIVRYFRLNKGGPDYISIPEIIFTSDFKITISIERDTSKATASLGGNNSTRVYQQIDGRLELANVSGGVFFTGALSGIADGELFTVTMERIGPSLTAEILGVTYNGTTTNTDTFSFLRIGTSNNITNHTTGVIADVEFYDSGVKIRNYPINDNDTTIRDLVSGQDGTVLNGNADDWGLFTDQYTLWKGQDLTVPPWVSVDQELIKA